jgi:hypothetical protein
MKQQLLFGFSLLAISACAQQTPPPALPAPPAYPTGSSTGAPFDGTYRFVSASKINAMYRSNKGDMTPCPDRTPGPLTIAQGRARYTDTGYEFQGTVGSQGRLDMRLVTAGGSRLLVMDATGSVDPSGTIRARQVGSGCSYDFVWQR